MWLLEICSVKMEIFSVFPEHSDIIKGHLVHKRLRNFYTIHNSFWMQAVNASESSNLARMRIYAVCFKHLCFLQELQLSCFWSLTSAKQHIKTPSVSFNGGTTTAHQSHQLHFRTDTLVPLVLDLIHILVVL